MRQTPLAFGSPALLSESSPSGKPLPCAEGTLCLGKQTYPVLGGPATKVQSQEKKHGLFLGGSERIFIHPESFCGVSLTNGILGARRKGQSFVACAFPVKSLALAFTPGPLPACPVGLSAALRPWLHVTGDPMEGRKLARHARRRH